MTKKESSIPRKLHKRTTLRKHSGHQPRLSIVSNVTNYCIFLLLTIKPWRANQFPRSYTIRIGGTVPRWISIGIYHWKRPMVLIERDTSSFQRRSSLRETKGVDCELRSRTKALAVRGWKTKQTEKQGGAVTQIETRKE